MNETLHYIDSPTHGRRFAIGDIHGCNLTLQALVHGQLQLTKQDQLFLLGDYVNRGPDSWGVLEYIMGLQTEGYQVYPLKGNHEVMLLDDLKRQDNFSGYSVTIQNKDVLKQVTPTQRTWLKNLLYYYVLDNFYLVHGAINTQIDNPLEDVSYMVWERETHDAVDFLQGKHIVHGHTVHWKGEIMEAVSKRADCIPLDNGCYKGVGGKRITPHDGSLCALDLDSWQLYIQNNVD